MATEVIGKANPSAGNELATESTLSSLEGKDFATETTLSAANTNLADIETLLTAIKNTDGVQTIDDIIRLGDTARNGINSILNNAIRRLEARSSLTSADGSKDIAVITDNSINRVESRNTIVGQFAGSGVEKKVTTIQDTEHSTSIRLQTEARLAPGSSVNIGTSIPANPAALEIAFLVNGSNENMLVNGSSTPVQFTYTPPAGEAIAVQSLLIVFTADDFAFDGGSFGPNPKMTNGLLIQTYVDSVSTDIFIIKQNEDFLRVPGRIPLVNNTGPKDILGVAFEFGGLLQLDQTAGDYMRITVRDDLTSVKLKYLTATIYGAVL